MTLQELHQRGPAAARFSTAMADAPSTTCEAVATVAALPSGAIGGGEIVLLAIKPSMWRPVFESGSWLVTTIALAVALAALGQPIPGLSLAATSRLVLLVGLARLAIAVIRWVPTWYVLTNRRVMHVHGVRAPSERSCLLIDIRNAGLSASPPEKLTGVATITFVIDENNTMPFVWRSIPRPDEVHAKIRQAIKNAIDLHNMGG